jgi:hypothetical protein
VVLLASASAASPAPSRSARSAFTVAFAPVLPPAIMGTLYPPKPFPTVGFCRPVLKFGRQCGDYTFKLNPHSGILPPGMSVDAQSGQVIGLPRGHADTYQAAGSKTPGLYQFSVCAVLKTKSVCKHTELAVFSNFAGLWKGSYQGDPGAFVCNQPLSGDAQMFLKQTVAVVKGTATSTVSGTVTLTNLPPISPDGTQNGPCTFSDQTFTLLAGNVTNPEAGGSNSTKGVWNVQMGTSGALAASLTIQDSGANGFFSQLSFTANH